MQLFPICAALCVVCGGFAAGALQCMVAGKGLDTQAPTTLAQFQCEVQKGHAISVIRVGGPDGKPPAGVTETTVNNAVLAQFQSVHYCIQPKFIAGGDPTAQVNAALDATGNPAGLSFPVVWIHLVGNSGWGSDSPPNIAFIQAVVGAVKKYYSKQQNLVLGIYTNRDAWDEITGNSQAFADLHLFWGDDGGPPDCSDWDWRRPDGGWTQPLMKEIKRNQIDYSCQNLTMNQLVVEQVSGGDHHIIGNLTKNIRL